WPSESGKVSVGVKPIDCSRNAIDARTLATARYVLTACMPGAMPLPSGAFCVLGALAARGVFEALDAFEFLGVAEARGVRTRAVFRESLRRAVRALGRLSALFMRESSWS